MIRHTVLLIAMILAAVAYFADLPNLALFVFALSCFMAGWTVAWPFAQADMIGTMLYEPPAFDEDLNEDE